MNHKNLVDNLINFLIPTIFLYALYFLCNAFLENGFFAIIYFGIIVILGFMAFAINNRNFKYYQYFQHLEQMIFAISLMGLIYFTSIIAIII